MSMTSTRAGGPPDQFKATLTLRGPDLDPTEIENRLGCKPDRCHRRGEQRTSGAPYADGLWSVTVAAGKDTNASELVTALLDKVSSSEAVWDELKKRYRVTVGLYVFLGSDNRDFVLSPDQLSRLAAIGAELWVDMYSD
jgi:hypothetical protein